MRTVETTARTRQEAIQKALKDLGVELHEVEIEILDEGSRGLFGFGARDVKVRVSSENAAPLPSPRKQERREERPERHERREPDGRREREPRPAKPERPARPERQQQQPKAEKKAPQERPGRPEKQQQQPRPERPRQEDRRRDGEPRREEQQAQPDRPPRGDRPDRPPRGDRPDRPPRGDRPDRPPRGDRPDRPPRGDRPDRPPRGDRAERPERPPRPPRSENEEAPRAKERPPRPVEEPLPPVTDARREEAAALLAEVLAKMGIESTVTSSLTEDGRARINIESKESAILIGRKGRNMQALEYILNRMMRPSETAETSERFIIDVENYLDRRRENLEDMARHLAEKAKETGRDIRVKPLSAQERRIIHLTLQDDPDVRTFSLGNTSMRTVVISPKTQQGRETPNPRSRRSRGSRRYGSRERRPDDGTPETATENGVPEAVDSAPAAESESDNQES